MSKSPSQEILCPKCKVYRAKYHKCYDSDPNEPLIIDLEPNIIYRRKSSLKTVPIIDKDKSKDRVEEEMFEVVERI